MDKDGVYISDDFGLPNRWLCPVSSWAGAVPAMAFSPDGKRLAVAGYSDELEGEPYRKYLNSPDRVRVWLWDVATGKELWRSAPNQLSIGAVAFSNHGKLLAAAVGQVLHLWNAETGKELTGDNGHDADIVAVAVSPDGKKILTGSTGSHYYFQSEGEFRAWTLPTGKQLWKAEGDWTESRWLFSLDGKSVASLAEFDTPPSYEDRFEYSPSEPCFWDLVTGKIVRRFHAPPIKPEGAANLIGLLGSRAGAGPFLAYSSYLDERLNLDSAGYLLAFAKGGKELVTWQTGGTICHWDIATGKQVSRFVADPEDGLVKGFSANGRRMAIGSRPEKKFVSSDKQKRIVTVRDFALNRILCRAVVPGPEEKDIFFSPDARSVVVSPFYGLKEWKPDDWPGKVAAFCLIESHTGKVRRSFVGPKPKDRHWFPRDGVHFAFSPDGCLLAAARDKWIRFWDISTGKLISALQAHESDVSSLAFSKDGSLLVSCGDTAALVWDVAALVKQPLVKPAPKLTPAQLDKLWQALAGDDAEKAFDAIWSLAASPGQTLPFLQKRVQPAPVIDKQQVAKWVNDLASAKFAVRQKATQELEKLGEPAEALLIEAQKDPSELEVKLRLDLLLEKIQSLTLPAFQIQQIRAVEVLDRIGNKEAIILLEKLAAGEPQARLTEEAIVSLERLGKP
jgi:WD40 repeat protein